MSFLLPLVVGSFGLLCMPVISWAGGTVTGKVSFVGKPPAPKEFLLSKFPNSKFCAKNPEKDATGKKRLLHEVEVGKDGSLQHAVVDEDGKFSIKLDVPAGKYKLVAWHPALNHKKPIEQDIEVKEGASATAQFEFKP